MATTSYQAAREHALLPLLLAVPIGLLATVAPPTIAMGVLLVITPLLLSFLSPLAGLYLLVFSMLLGPEFVVGQLGSGVTGGRGLTLRADDILLVLVGFGWLGRMAISRHQRTLAKTPLNRPIVWYVCACILATLIGVLAGRVRPMTGFFFLLKYYEYFFIFFMTVNIATSERDIRHLLIACFLTCGVVALYAIAQIPSGMRVSAPFEGQEGEPNTLGGYLVFLSALAAGLLLTRDAVRNKWPLLALLLLSAIALQATLSRASFLAAAVVLLGVLFSVRRRNPVLVLIILLGMMAIPLTAPQAVVDRVMYTFAQPKEAGQIQMGAVRVDTSTSERLRSWQQAIGEWKKSPVWGHGVTGGPFMDAMYPRVLTEVGLIGMTAFLLLMANIARVGVDAQAKLRQPFMRGLALGFLLGFVGLLVHAVGSNTFIIVRIMEPFWLVAALVVRSLMLEQAQLHPIPDQPGSPPALPITRYPGSVLNYPFR